MDKDGFYTINEIEKLLQREEDDDMNLTTWNKFLLQRFQRRIELVDKDEIIQTFADENVGEEVLKDAVLFCKEKCMESNQIVDREYRSFYKLMDELDEFVDRDDDAFDVLRKLENGEDTFLWELYAIALNKLTHPRIRRFLISLREMETGRG